MKTKEIENLEIKLLNEKIKNEKTERKLSIYREIIISIFFIIGLIIIGSSLNYTKEFENKNIEQFNQLIEIIEKRVD